jgi:hypothetical protein
MFCETKDVRKPSVEAPVALCHSKLFHIVAASAGHPNRGALFGLNLRRPSRMAVFAWFLGE